MELGLLGIENQYREACTRVTTRLSGIARGPCAHEEAHLTFSVGILVFSPPSRSKECIHGKSHLRDFRSLRDLL